MTPISERKLKNSGGTSAYSAEIISAQDYYPFGMIMPGRNFNADRYRYGFNGQEKDDEIKGCGNSHDFLFRIYETRLGRFLSTDPLENEYPWNSPYAFAENRPIDGRDLEGKEWENFMSKFKKPGELAIKLPNKRTAQIQFYTTSISNSKISFADFKAAFKSEPQKTLSNSKATFNAPVDGEGKPSQFKVGSYIKIDITGPMNNGYVKVIAIEEKEGSFSVTFATMEGHIEKGVIKFTITDKGNNNYDFSITSMSEVDQGAARIFEGTARGEQKKSWEEVLDKVVKTSGGTETKRDEKVLDPKPAAETEEKKEKKS